MESGQQDSIQTDPIDEEEVIESSIYWEHNSFVSLSCDWYLKTIFAIQYSYVFSPQQLRLPSSKSFSALFPSPRPNKIPNSITGNLSVNNALKSEDFRSIQSSPQVFPSPLPGKKKMRMTISDDHKTVYTLPITKNHTSSPAKSDQEWSCHHPPVCTDCFETVHI